MKKRVVISGGAGFVGSHVVEACINEGWDVLVIDDESAPENVEFYKFKGASYLKANICDKNTHYLYKNIDYVFHLAARSRIQPSMNGDCRETFNNNVIGTQSVLEASKNAGVKKVVYAGSSSVYGRANTIPYIEEMKVDCLNPYALSKFQGEMLGDLYYRMYGLPFVTLRYFNVFGEREPLKGLYAPIIGLFKRQRDADEKLTIVGDGEQRRDFTYVKDVARANILAAKSDIVSGVFNIGTGKNYSVNEIAKLVGGETVNIPERPGEARVTLADNSKAKMMLGWEPKFLLEDVINNY